MKRILFFCVITFLIALMTRCQDEATNDSINKQLTYLNSTPGGCNTNELSVKSTLTTSADTVIFSITDEGKLSVFVGINYICCASFDSEVSIEDDVLTISLTDEIEDGNYCRCSCYYTWDFLFEDYAEKPYHFQVILNDPRLEEPVIFREGEVDLAEID